MVCARSAPVCVLIEHLLRTLNVRGTNKHLLLTTWSPFKEASWNMLYRWTEDILAASGMDLLVFSSQSTRSASTSKAASKLPIKTILDTAGWRVFCMYYE